jgi:cellulose synthase/poly-beta-1,6-N-acetylglucosamine synthase-like glycosyltransferase
MSSALLYVILFISLYFEVFLFVTYFEKRGVIKNEKMGVTPKFYPSVTIIVPCYNEEKTILNTLNSLLALVYPKEKLSIIVVDDGSTDKTSEVATLFKQKQNIRIIRKENGGKYTALNLGLLKSESDVVGCLDADSFVEPQALLNIIPYFEDPSTMAVVPSIIVDRPQTILQMVQHIEYYWGVFLRKALSYLGALYVTPGPFTLFRREVFAQLGDYVEGHKTEDLEFALRMQKNGYKIVNAHGAHVHTVSPRTLKSLYVQRVRWTYGFLKNVIDYKGMFFKKEYGNLGMLVLPMATATIFTALFAMGLTLWALGEQIATALDRIATVGFSFSFDNFRIDWFYFTVDGVLLVSAALSLFTILLVLLGKKIAEGNMQLSRGVIYFFFIYPLITPLWLAKAVYNVVLSRRVVWK